MKKYGYKILAGLILVSVLAAAFWWGGNAPSLRGLKSAETLEASAPAAVSDGQQEEKQADITPSTEEDVTSSDEDVPPENQPSSKGEEGKTAFSQKGGAKTASTASEGESKPAVEEKTPPEGRREEAASSGQLTCTLSVRCDTILNNMSWLNPEKAELIPQDGVIFPEQTVVFYEGESVFNVLLREMKKNKIHLEFENMPVYKSAYIEGINNIYEFDCGELSGWMYRVNGDFPNFGSSRYQLKPGDKIEWLYTCDLGRDIGGGNSFQGIRR